MCTTVKIVKIVKIVRMVWACGLGVGSVPPVIFVKMISLVVKKFIQAKYLLTPVMKKTFSSFKNDLVRYLDVIYNLRKLRCLYHP